MNSKDMVLVGKESFFTSIASTWHPFTQQVPERLRNKFIDELVNLFVSFHSPDN
jgi:trans-aconitate 2-methyltransferase